MATIVLTFVHRRLCQLLALVAYASCGALTPALAQVPVATEEAILGVGTDFDHFGASVSVSGERALVGAPFHDLQGGIWFYGAAYVFVRDAETEEWALEVELYASDPSEERDEYFGYAVVLSGNRALVGMPGGKAVYVFERNPSTGFWTEEAKIARDVFRFGHSVALAGDRALVGTQSGVAYVFERDAQTGTWTETAMLTASDGAGHDGFGHTVALFGDRAIIGAPNDGEDDSFEGSAYVFVRDSETTAWTEEVKLTPSEIVPGARFGITVALHGNRVLIGMDSISDNYPETSSAYVFERDADTNVWTEVVALTTSAGYDGFGNAVALVGDRALIGAYRDRDGGGNSGAAHVFVRDAETEEWVEEVELSASDAGAGDEFGYAVALSEDRAVASAYWYATGSGSAYAFALSPMTPTNADDEAASLTFAFEAPYPNPADDTANLTYTLDAAFDVRLVAYDVLGREVDVVDRGLRPAGTHRVRWNLTGLTPGVYIVRLATGNRATTRRLVRR